MRDSEHYIELMLLYDTTEPNELIEAMVEDIGVIAKELKQNKHNWVCVSPGLYDDLYECSLCEERHMESIDNIDTKLQKYGCGVKL